MRCRKVLSFLVAMSLVLGVRMLQTDGDAGICAVEKIISVEELEDFLEKEGEGMAALGDSFLLEKPLYVKGKKVLLGGGHFLKKKRGKETGKFPLLQVNAGELYLKDVELNGGVKQNSSQRGGAGPLLEIHKGKACLDGGTRLQDNYLFQRQGVGGGVHILAGGTLIMKEGSVIQNNYAEESGSGIRIEKGGVAYLSGKVQSCVVKGAVGGAIVNYGTLLLEGGEICNNVTYGDRSLAGGIVNYGKIAGNKGKIRGNYAASARDIFNGPEGEIYWKEGIRKENGKKTRTIRSEGKFQFKEGMLREERTEAKTVKKKDVKKSQNEKIKKKDQKKIGMKEKQKDVEKNKKEEGISTFFATPWEEKGNPKETLPTSSPQPSHPKETIEKRMEEPTKEEERRTIFLTEEEAKARGLRMTDTGGMDTGEMDIQEEYTLSPDHLRGSVAWMKDQDQVLSEKTYQKYWDFFERFKE